MRFMGSIFLVCFFSAIASGDRIVPSSGDLCEFPAIQDAIDAGVTGNYASRLSVIKGYRGHAIEVKGASHDGGFNRKFGDLKPDIFGAKTIRFFIRQNVSDTGNFYLVLRFDNAQRYVTRTIAGGAGWGKWEKVELDLSKDRLGKLEEIGIYSDVFANTTDQYLQIDEMCFVMPGEYEEIEKDQSPILTVPKVSSTPSIDGKFESGEWNDSCAVTGFVTLSGVLADRQTTVYIQYDDQNLYVACRTVFESGGPPNMGNSGRMTYAEATSNLDFVELWLQTPVGYHQFIVNMNGGLFERNVQNSQPLASGARVACSLKMNEYLSGGVWNVESAIPFKGIGCSAPKEGDVWRVLFARTFSGQGVRSDRDWTSSNYTGGDFDRPSYFSQMQFSETAPAIQMLTLGDFTEGDVRLKGNIHPHGKETAKILLQIVDPKTGKVFINDVFNAGANDTDQKFEIGSLLKDIGSLQAKCLITAKSADRKRWYHQNFMFKSNPPFRVKCVPQGRNGGLLLDIDFSRVSNIAAPGTLMVSLTENSHSKKQTTLEFEFKDKQRFIQEIQTKDFSPGYYAVDVRLLDKTRKERAAFKNPNVWVGVPEWVKKPVGVTDEVPPPWKPVTVSNDNEVQILGRRYQIGSNGLPAAIVSGEKPLLAAPARFVVVTDKGPENVIWKNPRVIDAKLGKVTWEIRGNSDTFDFEGTLVVEYDGFSLWTLKSTAKKTANISSLRIEFLMPGPRALYARGNVIDGIAGGFAALLDGTEQGKSRVIAQTQYDPSGWTFSDRFMYNFFIGDDDSGISVMTESDQYHQGEKHIQVHNEGENRRVILHLTSKHRVRSGMPLRYEYAWVGLPLKSASTTARSYHACIGPTGDADTPVEKIDPELFRQCPNIIGGRYLRYDSQYEVLDPDPLKRPARSNGTISGNIPDIVKTINGFGAKVVTDGVYFSGADTGSPETQQFIEEWRLQPGGYTWITYHGSTDVGACPRSSWLEFQAYAAKRILENGINGIYLDVSSEMACNSPYHGCGYVDEQGKRQKTMNLWAIRELHKRIYTWYKTGGRDGRMFHHHLENAAWAGFCDAGFQGEEWASEREEQYSKMTPGFFRAMSMTQYGTPYTWFALYAYYQVTPITETMALCLPHRIYPAIWNMRKGNWPDIKPYWKILDPYWATARFIPYWSPSPGARCEKDKVLISAFAKEDHALLVIANWNSVPLKNVEVELDSRVLKLINIAPNAQSMLSGASLSIKNGKTLILDIPARDVVIVKVKE